jgi:uncharacterized membrane protein YgdD (TMEM256/DUF423 family)
MIRFLLILTGVMGASGVALAAAAAHYASGVGLDSAAYMLLFHASAVIAIIVAAERSLLGRTLGLTAALALVVGTALFSGDLAMRAFMQQKLFPMAAPIGGMLLIAGWIVVVPAALFARHQTPNR